MQVATFFMPLTVSLSFLILYLLLTVLHSLALDVDIVIRGRYVPPKEVASTDSNRLLHFHITGRTKQNLNSE